MGDLHTAHVAGQNEQENTGQDTARQGKTTQGNMRHNIPTYLQP